MPVYPTIINIKAVTWKTMLFSLFSYETIIIYKNNYFNVYYISF